MSLNGTATWIKEWDINETRKSVSSNVVTIDSTSNVMRIKIDNLFLKASGNIWNFKFEEILWNGIH